MLLNFTAKNYKSFADEMNFSMVAAPKQNDLSYSLFKGKAGGQNYRVQCSSVIYGPNASGKTNIISAIDTFKSIVLKGNIKNSQAPTNMNFAASSLELIPNINNTNNQPVKFIIEFIEGALKFKYLLSFDIGRFVKMDYPRKVTLEELYLNDKLMFSRSDIVKLGEYNRYMQMFFKIPKKELSKMEEIASSSLDDEEIFLTNGFKIIFSSELVNYITNWFEKKLTVIYRADTLSLVKKFSDSDKKGFYTESAINEAVKIFGANANAIGYIHNNEEDSSDVLCSIIDIIGESKKTLLPAEIFESYGTVRFANLFPLVLKAFRSGATLVIDEFDASIHPSALMNIINMFHNDSINKNYAQLIFNTHNPIFLNSNLFRRDEIKFVQRNHDTGNSELYSLSDFGTSGKNGVRNSKDYMKYYLNYSYGAIEDVDFSQVFENVVNNRDTENNGGGVI